MRFYALLNYCLIDPLTDARWDDLVKRHPSSSPYHTRGWLTALKHTYGFEPVVITTCPSGKELTNGIVFCRVRSCLTGPRLISLPFSDHCAPLVDKPKNLQVLLEGLRQIQGHEGWDYVELRPLMPIPADAQKQSGFAGDKSFCFHALDLSPTFEELSASFHKDCVLRKIRRTERGSLICEEGRSNVLLHQFYALQLQTRHRQNIPPQPYGWFKNLVQCLGDKLTIRIASLEGRAIASIITISDKNKVVYKYGCSDDNYSAHGGTQLLFWRLIQQAKEMGFEQLDLGRSDSDNEGLIKFKNRWGSTKSELTYVRYPTPDSSAPRDWDIDIARKIAAMMPDLPLSRAGTLLYRHFA